MDITSNLKETLEATDKYIAEQQELIERGKKLELLKQDPNFIDVIMNGYFNVEANKLFKILTNPSGLSSYSDDELRSKLNSIRDFKEYVGTADKAGTVEIEARNAPHNIHREEQDRLDMTARYAVDGE